MNEHEFHQRLKELGLKNTKEACIALEYNTQRGIIIDYRDVDRQFKRKDVLSNRESAMWELLFEKLQKRRKRRA